MAERNPNPRVLVIDPDGEAELWVRETLAGSGWDVIGAQSNSAEHDTFTYCHPFDIAVMNLSERTAHLLDMIFVLRQLSPKSEFIVISRAADERMWADVLARGAYDLFEMPPDREEFSSALLGALQREDRAESMNTADAA